MYMSIKGGWKFHTQYSPPWLRNIRNLNFSETFKALDAFFQSVLKKCKCYWQYATDLFTNTEVVENVILCDKLFSQVPRLFVTSDCLFVCHF